MMDQIRQRKTIVGIMGLIALCMLVFSGCSSFQNKGSASATAKKRGPMPVYYDFGDVLVPKELKVIKDDSFVYLSSGLSAGVLALKGRVELNSLIDFFENNMVKDNWIEVSAFKSPRTVLLFKKDTRWCIINITEQTMSTLVEIWVAPTMGEGGGGLLKG